MGRTPKGRSRRSHIGFEVSEEDQVLFNAIVATTGRPRACAGQVFLECDCLITFRGEAQPYSYHPQCKCPNCVFE